MIKDIRLGDVVRLRKPHPCGSYQWQVERLGADIGIRCLGCQRRVILERAVLERRMRGVVSRRIAGLNQYDEARPRESPGVDD